MVTLPSTHSLHAAETYEHYIKDNWEKLSPFEQEQARAYLHAKITASAAAQWQQQAGRQSWLVPTGYICAGNALLLRLTDLPSLAFFSMIFLGSALVLGILNDRRHSAHGIPQVLFGDSYSVVSMGHLDLKGSACS